LLVPLRISTAVASIALALTIIGILLCAALLLLLALYRKRSVFKNSSPQLLLCVLVGVVLMLLAGNFLIRPIPTDDG
jgi:hypothetical protein